MCQSKEYMGNLCTFCSIVCELKTALKILFKKGHMLTMPMFPFDLFYLYCLLLLSILTFQSDSSLCFTYVKKSYWLQLYNRLQPITFHYLQYYDPSQSCQHNFALLTAIAFYQFSDFILTSLVFSQHNSQSGTFKTNVTLCPSSVEVHHFTQRKS